MIAYAKCSAEIATVSSNNRTEPLVAASPEYEDPRKQDPSSVVRWGEALLSGVIEGSISASSVVAPTGRDRLASTTPTSSAI